MRNLLPLFLILLLIQSCGKVENKVVDLATENLKLSLENPNSLKVIGVSKVDSAYGINYFTQQELRGIFEVTKKVTEKVVKQTNNLTDFNTDDQSSLSLLERQLRASTEVRSLILKSGKKGSFSGYKVKIDYECEDLQGNVYRSERWFFTNPEATHILKTFELPLP